MADGDKHVSLAGLKAVYDHLDGNIDNLKSAVKKSTGNAIISFSSGYIDTSGETTDYTTVDNNTYKYAVLDCAEGDKFTLNGKGTTNSNGAQRLWAFVDSATPGNIISRANGNIEVTDLVITAPQNASKLVLNLRTDTLCYIGEYLQDVVSRNMETVMNLFDGYTDINAFEAGGISLSTGENNNVTAIKNTRIRSISTLPGSIVFLTIKPGYTVRVLAYDDGSYVGEWDGTNYSKETSHTFINSVNLWGIGDHYSYRIVIGKSDGSNIVAADYLAVTFCVLRAEKNLYNQEITGWADGYISTNNAPVDVTDVHPSSTGMRHVVVPCKFNDTFIISGTGANTAQLWAFINDDGTEIIANPGIGTTESGLLLKAPRGSAYLVLNDKTNSASYKADTMSQRISVQEKLEKNHLNILIFGNSYAADAWGYVPFILKKYGITVNIYLYYRGSGSIRRLVAEWEDDSASGTDIYDTSHIRRLAHIDTRYSTRWDAIDNDVHPSPKQVLLYQNDATKNVDKWDIITLQHVSSEEYSDGNGGYTQKPGLEPYFRQAINLIAESYGKNYNLGLFTTYNRIKPNGTIPSTAMDNRIETLSADEAVYNTEPFNFVIPVGAAVFSARTNPLLASTVISDIGNLWASDYIHLQEGVPCYIAALTVCQALFNRFFPQHSIMNDDTRITQDMVVNLWHVPFRNGTVKEENVTDLHYELAQKCAVAANNNPFDITPIYSPSDTTEIVYNRAKYAADSMIDTSGIDPSQA